MNANAAPDIGCGALIGLSGLDSAVVHRMLVGQDPGPQAMTPQEAAQELGDPFATLLLLKGRFPTTGRGVLKALAAATPDGDPLRSSLFFLLGEGSQIRWTPETDRLSRGLRFVVACGAVGEGPDIVLSVFHPDAGDIELMAWDRKHGGFNFYRTVGPEHAWVWAGNSRHALTEPTKGSGPYESHPSGSILMKELRAPWVNWHSPDANIFDTVFRPGDPLRTHEWFQDLQGADVCEAAVARPSIERWAKARFAQIVGADGRVDDPARVMEQILDTPTVNLITSHTESGAAVAGSAASVDLPQMFFINSRALSEQLGLEAPPAFSVVASSYADSLVRTGSVLQGNASFRREGDTHFAFIVPERAFEDDAVLAEAVRVGLLSERFAATLLMVDFPNPIYSERRKALMVHVPPSAVIANGASSFSQEMANQIVAAAHGTPGGGPEQEFADLWEAGEAAGENGWRDVFNARLRAYYGAVEVQLGMPPAFDDYARLAESRRNRVRQLPIFENALLFPHTLPVGERTMRDDGTVAEA